MNHAEATCHRSNSDAWNRSLPAVHHSSLKFQPSSAPLSLVPDPPMTPPEKANFLQASLQVWRLIPKTTCPCPSPVISQNYSCSKSPTVSAIPPNAPARKVSLPTNCAAALLPSAALAHPVSMPSRPSTISPNAPSPGSAVSSASPLPMARPPSFPTPSPWALP